MNKAETVKAVDNIVKDLRLKIFALEATKEDVESFIEVLEFSNYLKGFPEDENYNVDTNLNLLEVIYTYGEIFKEKGYEFENTVYALSKSLDSVRKVVAVIRGKEYISYINEV